MKHFDKVLNILLKEMGLEKGGKFCDAVKLTEAAKRICKEVIDENLNSISLPCIDLVVNEGYNIANSAGYNYRRVLKEPDHDIYYSGWMDCYDWLKGEVHKNNIAHQKLKKGDWINANIDGFGIYEILTINEYYISFKCIRKFESKSVEFKNNVYFYYSEEIDEKTGNRKKIDQERWFNKKVNRLKKKS